MSTKLSLVAIALLTAAILPGCSSKSSNIPTPPVIAGPPVLTSVNGATLPSGPIGSTVVLEGARFGAVQDSSKVLFSNGTGGSIAATIASPADWSDNLIITTVPPGTATGPVWVRTASGTSDSLTFTVTQNASFSPSTISWSSATPLPVGLSGHAAVFASLPGTPATNLVYVIGGADSTKVPGGGVWLAPVQGNGSLGAWSATASLPVPTAFLAAAVATPFNSRIRGTGCLYALGGATDEAGSPTTAVYQGQLSPAGSVAAWTRGRDLPLPLHSLGVALFHGDLYIAGGSTAGNAPVANVYRARIDTTGALGAWQALPSLPAAVSYHGFVTFGGYLYIAGGETAVNAPNDSSNTGTQTSQVAYAKIDLRTGNLAAAQWTPSLTSLTKAVSKHSVELGGGNLLVSAGIYNGALAGSSEQSYAQVNADGSLSSFNGATGSHTIASAGGKNLFNHAGISYVDGTGVAHVMVIGGDDLNAPGKKRAEVWFY